MDTRISDLIFMTIPIKDIIEAQKQAVFVKDP